MYMNPFEYYKRALQNYVNFEGRDTRSEFWYFVLVNLIISLLLSVIVPSIAPVYSFAVALPALAVGARRLHDTGRSGWWQLIGIIPLIGLIILIIFTIEEGQPGSNVYGAPRLNPQTPNTPPAPPTTPAV